MKIYDLTCEHLKNPVGITESTPRFSWKITSGEKNVMQKSYRIVVESERGLLWDSGKVISEQSQNVEYCGKEFESCERATWSVFVETNNGESTKSDEATFEIGFLSTDNWQAKWIQPERDVDAAAFNPAQYLRKTFTISGKIKCARIYQTAHGLYDFYINGRLGTEDKFTPGFTSYHKRLQYQIYDITDMLDKGENCLAVRLADGWWRGTIGGTVRNGFGNYLAYLCQIVIDFEDGTTKIIASDESFKCATGGLIVADMKVGEVFDATKEQEGWKLCGFDDSKWQNVLLETDEFVSLDNLIPSLSVPCREAESFKGEIFEDANGDVVLNFKQNIAGYIECNFKGLKKGQKITLVFGEDIKDGKFSIENLAHPMSYGKVPFQEVTYIARGKAFEHYKTTFAIFGFQYMKVSGLDERQINVDTFTAHAVYSKTEYTGELTTSSELINQLVKNSRWSQKGNFLDVPTDCPTRERAPWTGDSQIYAKTATLFADVQSFFEKWLADLSAEQFKNGKIPNISPNTMMSHNKADNEARIAAAKEAVEKTKGRNDFEAIVMRGFYDTEGNGFVLDGAAGWGDTATITPWTMYLCYGDKKILEKQYETAKRWVGYMISMAKNVNPLRADEEYYKNGDGEYVWDSCYHFGEWLEPNNEANPAEMATSMTRPDEEIPTAYLCYSSRLLSKMATLLGNEDDAEKYGTYSEKIKETYNKYMIKSDGEIRRGRQAPLVRALAFDLVFEENKQKVINKLKEYIIAENYHLNTGFLSTAFLLNTLADVGLTDEAFKILEQETSPSWLYNVKLGATTILENWDGMEKHAASYNHYSYGALCDFLFSYVCGIRPQIENAGYKRFTIKPVIGGSLKHASCLLETPYGTVKSAWKAENGKTVFEFTVPCNTTACIKLPCGKTAELGSGEYKFEC